MNEDGDLRGFVLCCAYDFPTCARGRNARGGQARLRRHLSLAATEPNRTNGASEGQVSVGSMMRSSSNSNTDRNYKCE
jgi:hypothetical protein